MPIDRRHLLGGLAATPAAFAVPACASAQATPDAALEAVFAATSPPALAGAIITRAGLVWSEVRGLRRAGGTTSATLADRWHIGSNTKAMTAAVFARLVEAGRARWDLTPDPDDHDHGDRSGLCPGLDHRAGLSVRSAGRDHRP